MVVDGTDHAPHAAIELVLARLLRLGSVLAATLLIAGIADIVFGLSPIGPKLVTAGLLVLMGTPILRVVVAAIIFFRDREWFFALFSLVVLVAVGLGIFLGGTGG